MTGLFTTDTLAAYLQVSPHTVRREREAGRLPFIRIRDLVRYRPEDVEDYLSSHTQDRDGMQRSGITEVATLR